MWQNEPKGYLELRTFNLSHVLHPRKFINWTVSGKFRYPSLYFRRRKQRCRCSIWDILTTVVSFFFFFNFFNFFYILLCFSVLHFKKKMVF